jgi:ABC-2 type transport system permease protein
LRDRSVLFFNYLFPVIFFLVFAQFMGAALGGGIPYVVGMVFILGILGNGLFGAGVRATQEREANILRRFKVTPVSPTPLLVASMITGWFVFIPTVAIVMGMAILVYGMPMPERWLSLFVLISLGVVAFRSIGLIVASVANSIQESNILIQLLYMPMLFLSGATFPISSLPDWARIVAQFLPASYLVTGFQGIFYRRETLLENWSSVLALVATTVFATFVATQLFRWEKDEKIRPSAKMWVLGVLLPFVVLGCYQVWTQEQLRKADELWEELQQQEVLEDETTDGMRR